MAPELPLSDEANVDDVEIFRETARVWLAEHKPRDWRERLSGAGAEERAAFDRVWIRELHAAGLAVPHWPVEFGGSAISIVHEIALHEAFLAADAPWPDSFYCAVNHVAHVIEHFGNDHHRAHLSKIVRGDEIWCQAFSEPDAGSDLASLKATAVRDGDHYVVNGQKTWSTVAPVADWAIAPLRTKPRAPKRQGISFFFVDLRTSGIEVREIKKMGGATRFGEIFFTDAIVPAADRVGEENDGWTIVRSVLSAERGAGFVGFTARLRAQVDSLLRLAAASGAFDQPSPEDADVSQILANLVEEATVLEHVIARVLRDLARSDTAGPQSSLPKLMHSELARRVTELGVRLCGLEGQLESAAGGRSSERWLDEYLASFAYLIGGGTSEMQRNHIAEAILGLPREPTGRTQQRSSPLGN